MLLPPEWEHIYLGTSGGINYSKLNYNNIGTDYRQSYQIALRIENLLIDTNKNYNSGISYGFSIGEFEFEEQTSENNTKVVSLNNYIFPVIYQHRLVEISDDFSLFGQLGAFINFMHTTKENEISNLPWFNFGGIIGINLTYLFSTNWGVVIEYNLHNGLAPIDNTYTLSSNISHVINIGFKFPSNSIF